MATIVFAAVGQYVGGPIGSAVGALIGSQIDARLFRPGGREGARLKDMQVTTSSYGTPIARHYGRTRAPGSIIWATDLKETGEKKRSGKGSPAVTSFTYSASFAVALASRPIQGLGRIWADGSLLRGEAGDLKVGGTLRIYSGHGDQQPDALMVSALGPHCPAFRGLAYCVFEDLQLAEYGNRIPTLTFEIVADDGEVALEQLVGGTAPAADVARPLGALVGFSEEGGPLTSSLEAIDQVYPLTCDASGRKLTIRAADDIPADPVTLPHAAADPSGDSFAAVSGESRRRQADQRDIPEGMRYYDLSRDYQPSLQRADGRAQPGRTRIIEFPGALDAQDARDLANRAAERAAWSSERIGWRLPELDPTLSPGQIVRVPGRKGLWRIEGWEWRETGVELELLRLPHGAGRRQAADAGAGLPPTDLAATQTLLQAFELPWDGTGSSAQRQAFVAASSTGAGWQGAALYVDNAGVLEPVGGTGKTRATIGSLATALPSGNPHLFDPHASMEVTFASADFLLVSATLEALANGVNRVLVGSEILQFATAVRLDDLRWRLEGLLRGRGATEDLAAQAWPAGTSWVLLDDTPVALDASLLGQATGIAAIGMVDPDPVVSSIIASGATLRPLSPVHASASLSADGGLSLRWARRARGNWGWQDLVETPLVEESERYLVGLGDVDSPALLWDISEPQLAIGVATLADLASAHPGQPLWVRQVGNHAASAATHLYTFA